MIVIHDYSRMPIGTGIDNGKVCLCPYCRKNALANDLGGKTFYTHRFEQGLDAQGEEHMEWESCPKLA